MKTTIEMAREAGLRDCTCDGTKGCLERFAELVRSDEREACAKVCELVAREIDDTNGTASYIAHHIRARSNT